MIKRLQGLLDVTITLEAYESQDRFGTAAYGPPEEIVAHIERGVEESEGGRSGTSVGRSQALVGRYKIILGAPVLVDPRDRITLPKEFGSRDENGKFQDAQPPILMVRPVFYHGDHDHTVLICG